MRGGRGVLPDKALFLYMYVRKEAVLSSQIEGTQSLYQKHLCLPRQGVSVRLIKVEFQTQSDYCGHK